MKKRLIICLFTITFITVCFSQQDSNLVSTKFYDKLKWRNIGPQRGGRSLGCTGTPGRPLEYYFGATGGGLWKTTDGGQTWAAVTDLSLIHILGKTSMNLIGTMHI